MTVCVQKATQEQYCSYASWSAPVYDEPVFVMPVKLGIWIVELPARCDSDDESPGLTHGIGFERDRPLGYTETSQCHAIGQPTAPSSFYKASLPD